METEFDRRSIGYPARTDHMDSLSGHGNIAQMLSAYRGGFESPSTTLAWIVGTSVIVGFLTAMLLVGIAITV